MKCADKAIDRPIEFWRFWPRLDFNSCRFNSSTHTAVTTAAMHRVTSCRFSRIIKFIHVALAIFVGEGLRFTRGDDNAGINHWL